MVNIYVLSGILIEKCSFWVSCQSNAKSGAIDQVTLDDQSVDGIDPLANPGLFQSLKLYFLVRILNILPEILYSQPLLKDSLSL